MVRTRNNAASLAMSPWARRAVSRDGRDSSTNDVLDDRGDAILDEQRAARTMEFTIRNTGAALYKRDWDLGDLVVVNDSGFERNMKIQRVKIAVASTSEETITPIFISEVFNA